jgi:3-(3-hydroxy-phenyl)propionate hydroxylase
VDFELVWCSVYTFSCTRMAHFRHGRVLFAGDAAHGVSPFGARGANSGVEDAANLAWKLHYVLRGDAHESLLDSYGREREPAADENIRHSTRSADFLTPKSETSRIFRDAVLGLARDHPFARRLVNSGRLSTASTFADSPLNTPDRDAFAGPMVPGAAAADAPIAQNGEDDWLLRHLGGRFVAMRFANGAQARAEPIDTRDLRVDTLVVNDATTAATNALVDREGLAFARYDAKPGTTYLFRPDQHVCARWRSFDRDAIGAAVARAIAK